MVVNYVQTSYFEACDGSLFLTAEDCLRYEDILKEMKVLKVGVNDRIIEFGVIGCGDKYTNSEIMHILFGYTSNATMISEGMYDASKADDYVIQFLLLGDDVERSLLAQSGCIFKDADIIDLQKRLETMDQILVHWECDVKMLSDFADADRVETWTDWVRKLKENRNAE